MGQETLNLSLRKFLKTVGVGSQREIGQAIVNAIATSTLTGAETPATTMTLSIDALQFEF